MQKQVEYIALKVNWKVFAQRTFPPNFPTLYNPVELN